MGVLAEGLACMRIFDRSFHETERNATSWGSTPSFPEPPGWWMGISMV